MPRSSIGGAAESPTWDANEFIGTVLDGRYRVEDVLGTGGVGVVYRAEHLKLQRPVAVKVLHERFGSIDELRRRFEREAQALSALSHPNVVSVNDYGISDGTPYLVMELLEGRTLADLIDDDGPPPIEDAIEIQRQILRGLAFAHDKGIVHRDLKAANIFLQALPDAPNHVKILDFGLAKIFTTGDGVGEPTLTKSGTILGTPAYMPPEQATGGSVDVRADVYSAGVVLFEILTGRYPFEASARADMLRAHLLLPMPDPEEWRPGLSLSLELNALLGTAMKKDRTDRFANAAEMLAALDALPAIPATFDASASSREVSRPSSPRDDQVTMTAHGAGEEPPRAGLSVGRMLPFAAVGLGILLLGLAAALLVGSPDEGARGVADDGTAVDPPPAALDGPTDVAGGPEQAPEPDPAEISGDDIDAHDPVAADVDDLDDPDDLGDVTDPEAAVDNPTAWPAVRDPFEGPLPQELRRFHRRVRQGQHLSVRDRRDIGRLQRSMPGDARASLVLAHHFVDISYYGDAVQRYERAVAIDRSARGDRRMLPDLLRMAQSPTVAVLAADVIVQAFGAEAISAVEAAMEEQTDPEKVGMLTRLRSRLPASSGDGE
ncbi:MAG: serine/threonine protein kinase [Deltaproteobacteria bacterium]|nr:serine/threonine protein kinase [Deltaproteobacteria bacterium]